MTLKKRKGGSSKMTNSLSNKPKIADKKTAYNEG